MKITSVTFLKSAANASGFPKFSYPEFAFFGRSNVGKSSLINMIVSRKSLVKTGARPGVTRLVNFFLINENISFADMPGFGYADLPQNIRGKFMPLIKNYILNRDNLKIAFLLVDIRRTPDEAERNIVTELAGRDRPVAVVATKCDKLPRSRRLEAARKIAAEFMIDVDSIFFTSAKTGEGKREIHRLIGEYCI